MSEIPQSIAAELTLAAFAGHAPAHHLLEVRYRDGKRWHQAYFGVRDRAGCATFAARTAEQGDTYVSAVPRVRNRGRATDTGHAYVAWVDHDGGDGVNVLLNANPAPSIVIATGTPGHALGIYQLSAHVDDIRPVNQRLAHALSGDLNACDKARVLRLPGTLNHKHTPAQAVTCLRLEPTTFTVEELVGHLPEFPPPKTPPERRPSHELDVLQSIPATEYVPALTGQELSRDGKIACPFHDDRTPSLHAYPGDRGWSCFGCGRGGTIIDLGAALYGIEPRGAGYHEIRRRVAADLLGTVAA